jgi:hypothetical protein
MSPSCPTTPSAPPIHRWCNHYLGSKSEMVITFSADGADGTSPSPMATPPSAASKKKPGLEGTARPSSGIEFGLTRRRTTLVASGRSTGFSWTHSSPISMQFRTSSSGYCPASDGSTTSAASPVLHFLHTCIYQELPGPWSADRQTLNFTDLVQSQDRNSART